MAGANLSMKTMQNVGINGKGRLGLVGNFKGNLDKMEQHMR